jgi:peptidyl-tRNA hydrolase
MTVFAEMEQVNAFNNFQKASSGPYSETYNLGWRNHPNFSWKQNQPITNQGGAPHPPNHYPLGFSSSYQNHGCSAPLASSSSYQALTQAPASSTQLLEETMRDFMKMTNQSISDVRHSTMVNTQAISKLEMQMGQLANHLGERDKGKLPSQVVNNPKACSIGNSSNQEHVQSISDVRHSTMVNTQAISKLEMQMGQLANHLGEKDKGKLPSQAVNNPKACSIGNSSNQEHVQVIVTLRSRKRVDNKVVNPEADHVEQEEPKGEEGDD